MRSVIKNWSYRAIDRGLRLPAPKELLNYAQLSRTIDLIRARQVTLVLDVGANRGWYAYHLRKAGYRGRIISFEPIPHEHTHVETLAAGDDLWTAHNVALGDEDGERVFNLITAGGGSDQTVLSSFLEPRGALGGGTEKVPVTVRRLDRMLPGLVPDIAAERIFLKMDTQGYDLMVFAGAAALLDRIVLLQSEISVEPLYEGMPPYTESLARYHAAGLNLADLFVVNRTATTDILEYDCLMQRS